MEYRHQQRSRWTPLLVVVVLAAASVLFLAVDDDPTGVWFAVGLAALLIALAAIFGRLEVTVDERSVQAAFGWGWPRRRVAVVDVESATPVRNRWYHGWGIRKVAGGWMFNVAGSESVELRLRSGRVFRIGSDEPVTLAAAIESARRVSSPR